MEIDLESFVGDYLASEHYAVAGAGREEHAGALLAAFVAGARELQPEFPEQASADLFLDVLLGPLARLDVPVAARQGIPRLLGGFFDYLESSGRFPAAAAWTGWMSELAPGYLERLRPDGSVRGETRRKAWADVGRNDPCPCGSGLKYKKCCLGLFA